MKKATCFNCHHSEASFNACRHPDHIRAWDQYLEQQKKQNFKDFDYFTSVPCNEIIPITEIQKPKIDPTIARRPSETCELHDYRYNHLPEHCQPLAEQIAFIKDNLKNLKENPDHFTIEGLPSPFHQELLFGSSDIRKGSDGIGICFALTAGGYQYKIYNIDMFGRPNATLYTTNEEELIDDAIDRMARYMRPLRLKIKPENKTPHAWRLRNTD